MPSVIQPAEFFVVGGPVQPERSCYVEREADRRLAGALRAKRLCCVLGARAIGKSSLLRRAARALRATGTLVVTVDLRRIAEQSGSDTPEDWLRRVAERIAAELELDVDSGAWWSAHDALGENRLVEFFWQVVLTNTTAPVVVLVDEVDAVVELPFAADFLDAIDACYERRSREPDFARLCFVLAGRTSLRVLAEETPDSAFAHAEVIEPEDFSAEQSYRLAVAFGGEQELAQALMDRIRVWTGGHPYLTQRVARGVARKGGRLEDVERVVRDQLLAPGAADKDPLLAHVRALLGEPSRSARRATLLLEKIAAGSKVKQPSDVTVWEHLWLSGTVRVEEGRTLRVANRIVKELVAARWLKAKSGGRRWLAAAAVLLGVLAGGGFWYTQQLPVADIATLSSVDEEPAAVEAAYGRLRALPGFAERADALWLEALGRQSRAATTLAVAAAVDTRLRELPAQDANADRLLSEFWLRRAREAAQRELRDPAILLAQRAAALPAADPAAAAYLADLVDEDYARLERSLRLAGTPEYWHMTFAQSSLVSIDGEQQALRTPFGAAAGVGALGAAPLKLTALTHVALAREVAAEGEGTAGAFELALAVQHTAPAELLVTLIAPSGAEAVVTVPRSDGALVETFVFQGTQGALAQLADEGVRGVWRLTVVDRVAGNTGLFGGWSLTFGDSISRDDPAELVPIPDPTRIEAVNVLAVADRAVAWPIAPGAIGTVALWNLMTGRLEQDFTLPTAPRQVALDAQGQRVLAATSRVLMLWNVADGAPVARVATETEFVLPPVFSADGGYVAIAERVDAANPLYSVLRSADASLVATIEGAPDVQGWELGPGGLYVALQGPETVVRVLETRRGAELRRLAHAQPVARLLHSSDGARLVTVERSGAIAAWSLAPSSAELGRPLGHTATAASVSASGDARRLAFTRDDGAVSIVDVAAGAELYRLRLPRSVPETTTQLSADGAELVTQSAAMLKLWSLPSKAVTARAGTAEPTPTALALDRSSDLVAVGLASGQLLLTSFSAAGSSDPALAYFGHRGRITAAALNAGRGIAATGGSDGIVRVWDAPSGAPAGTVMQPADAPVALVALSPDGRLVASAAERFVRVANVADGRVIAELQGDGVVTALGFGPAATVVAVGDSSGAVRWLPLDGAAARAMTRLEAAPASFAFAPDGSRLAVGDTSGTVTLLAAASGASDASARLSSQPIRWLEWSPDGTTLLVATDAWLHTLAAEPALAPLQNRLVVWPAASAARTAISTTAVGFAGVAADGALAAGEVDLASSPNHSAADSAALVTRDWAAAFALRLNDNGEPVPFDP